MSDEDKPIYLSREKLWTECDAAEKLEVLRDTVLTLLRQMDALEKAIVELERHLHMPDGRIVREVERVGTNRLGFYTPMGLRDRE
jgi:hypothetical protein